MNAFENFHRAVVRFSKALQAEFGAVVTKGLAGTPIQIVDEECTQAMEERRVALQFDTQVISKMCRVVESLDRPGQLEQAERYVELAHRMVRNDWARKYIEAYRRSHTHFGALRSSPGVANEH